MMSPMYASFCRVEERDGHLYGIESFVAIRAEVDPILMRQWGETESLYKDGEPDPDYRTYTKYEQMRVFYFFTARVRKTRELIGYLAVLIGPGLHDMNVMRAKEQAFYVVPEARGRNVGAHLLGYAERMLEGFGVDYLDVSSKEPVGAKDLAPLMKRRKYTAHSVVYTKKLGE